MDELRLDGNAAAGLLGEVFATDVTTAVLRCAHCGAEAAVATAMVYMRGPGTVMRCADCEEVVMRFARIRGELVADLRGVERLAL
jgi:hypothetical protein